MSPSPAALEEPWTTRNPPESKKTAGIGKILIDSLKIQKCASFSAQNEGLLVSELTTQAQSDQKQFKTPIFFKLNKLTILQEPSWSRP